MLKIKILLTIAVSAAALVFVQCGSGSSGASGEKSTTALKPADDFRATMKAYDKADGDEAKQKLWMDFLDRNPDNRYTVSAISLVANTYYIKEKNDPDGAISFARKYAAGLKDEKLKKRADMMLIGLYGRTGNKEGLEKLAGEIEAGTGLSLADYQSVADAALEAGDWDFARAKCEALIARDTPETVRAEARGETSNDEVQKTIARNRGRALIGLGRASMGLEDTKKALSDFEEASKSAQFNYAGFPAWPFSDLNLHWAKALLAAGRASDAMDRIAPDALILRREEAMEVYRDAYGKSGKREAFDTFVESARSKAARTMPDFTAHDYDGKKVSYKDLKGKATLLAFWFPT